MEQEPKIPSWLQEADQTIYDALVSAGDQGCSPEELVPILQLVKERFNVGPASHTDIAEILDELRRQGKIEVGGNGWKVKSK